MSTTPTTTEQQRELLRGAYTQGVLNNYERLANSPSERVRFKALRRLAQIVGIVHVLPQIYDLAREAQSDRIALQANDLIADHLGIGTETSADDRPEPLKFTLTEELTAEQTTPDSPELSRQPHASPQFTPDPLPDPPQPQPPKEPPKPAEAWREHRRQRAKRPSDQKTDAA